MAPYAPKGSKQLYRDLLRLIKHMSGTTSQKSVMLRKIVAQQFRENAHVTDPAKLHVLKSSAERGLSNYLIFMNSKTDPKVAAQAAEVGQYEDDEATGQLVKVLDTNKTVRYPHARVSREQQASGELPASAGTGVAAGAGAGTTKAKQPGSAARRKGAVTLPGQQLQ